MRFNDITPMGPDGSQPPTATADDPNHAYSLSQARDRLVQQQNLLQALQVRLKQVLAYQQLTQSPVRIISRAVATRIGPRNPANFLYFQNLQRFWRILETQQTVLYRPFRFPCKMVA
jgi:hypothetical protein